MCRSSGIVLRVNHYFTRCVDATVPSRCSLATFFCLIARHWVQPLYTDFLFVLLDKLDRKGKFVNCNFHL